MFQLLLLRGYRSLPANSAAHFLAFGCGASSLIWFDLTLMSLQVVKRSNTLSEWELFFLMLLNNFLAVLLVQLYSLVIEDSEKWLLDILKPERRVLSGDSKSNGGFVIFSIRNKYFPQFYAGMTSDTIKHVFSCRKTLSMWSHVLLCTTLESNTMQERWDHNICLLFLLLCFCGFNGAADWFKVKPQSKSCVQVLFGFLFAPVKASLWRTVVAWHRWCMTWGGCWRRTETPSETTSWTCWGRAGRRVALLCIFAFLLLDHTFIY